MEKLLLIDGSSVLSKCYFGSLPLDVMADERAFLKNHDENVRKAHYADILKNPEGKYVNGVFYMLMDIMNILRYQQPSHIIVAFDKTRNTFRRELYPEYKANRPPKAEPLSEQFIMMTEILKRLGITVCQSNKYEADDLIGSLAKKFETQIPVVAMTKDHDYLQLINKNTKVWMMTSSEEKKDALVSEYGEQENLPFGVYEYDDYVCWKEEGVMPSQIPDKKGIAGDTSDNIPGVKGVATACLPLIRYYGSVENLYKEMEHEGPDIETMWKADFHIRGGNYKKLMAEGQKDMALLSKDLATIRCDIPLKIELERMEVPALDFIEKIYSDICRENGFDIILADIERKKAEEAFYERECELD